MEHHRIVPLMHKFNIISFRIDKTIKFVHKTNSMQSENLFLVPAIKCWYTMYTPMHTHSCDWCCCCFFLSMSGISIIITIPFILLQFPAMPHSNIIIILLQQTAHTYSHSHTNMCCARAHTNTFSAFCFIAPAKYNLFLLCVGV